MNRIKELWLQYWFYILIGVYSGLITGLLCVYFFFMRKQLDGLATWLGAIGTNTAVWTTLYLAFRKKPIRAELYLFDKLYGTSKLDQSLLKHKEIYPHVAEIHGINPDDQNYIAVLKDISLYLDGVKYKKFEPVLFVNGMPANLKKFVVPSGSDVTLFTLDVKGTRKM